MLVRDLTLPLFRLNASGVLELSFDFDLANGYPTDRWFAQVHPTFDANPVAGFTCHAFRTSGAEEARAEG
jgi:hypothetical protein